MYKDIDIYNIGYITILKIGDCENSVNSLCLIIDKVDEHIECSSAEKNNGDKYLDFHCTDENKEVLKKYRELWDWIKNEIETELKMKLKQETVVNMVKILWKLKFTTDDNLSLNKALNLHCEQ